MKISDLIEPPPQATRARESPELRKNQTNDPTRDSGARAREGPDRSFVRSDWNSDLQLRLLAACAAAGFEPSNDAMVRKAQAVILDWTARGLDFDLDVIPTIQRKVEGSSDPTSSLNRFNRDVLLAHAKRGAKPKRSSAPPPEPLLQVESEPEVCFTIRQELVQALGPYSYCYHFNRLRFEPVPVDEMGEDPRRPIRLNDERGRNIGTGRLDGRTTTVLRRIVANQGFSDVW